MRRCISTLAVAASLALSASALTTDPASAAAYVDRASQMLDNDNVTGSLQQLRHALTLPIDDDTRREARFLLAVATLRDGDATQAHRLFDEYLRDYPAAPDRQDAMMYVADCVFDSHDFIEALRLYTAVDPAALTPERRLDYDYRTAYCMLKVARYDDALPRLAALFSNRTYANAARLYTGYAYYAKGQYDKALNMLQTVNRNATPGEMADYYIAQIQYHNGAYNEALTRARALLGRRNADIDPLYVAEANRLAGESLYRLGDRNAAIPYIESYVKAVEHPVPSALYILGLSYYSHGLYDDAVRTLTPVTECDNAMGQSAYLYIGQSLLHLDDSNAAILAFDKALNLPYDTDVQETAFYNYAVAKHRGGSIPFGHSAATFEDFLRRFPDSRYGDDVQEYIVSGYIAENNYDEALAAISRMARPSDASLRAKQMILHTLGTRALAADDPIKALVYLRQARALDRYDAAMARNVLLSLGEAQYANGELNDALESLTRYVSTAPKADDNLPVALYDLAYTQFALKDYTAALKTLRSLIAYTPSLPDEMAADVYNRMADCLYYDSQFTAARDAYDKAFALSPENGDYARYQQAMMQGYSRDYRAKIQTLDDMMTRFPQSILVPDALLEQTEAWLALKEPQRAVDVYQALIDAYPATTQGRQAYLQMALTLYNMGRTEQAKEAYATLIRLYPSSDEARMGVDELKQIYADAGDISSFIAMLQTIDGAPTIDPAEGDRLSFESAERNIVVDDNTLPMEQYIANYPNGRHVPHALWYLVENAYNHGNSDLEYRYASRLVAEYPDNAYTENAYIVLAESAAAAGKGAEALRAWLDLEQRASSSENLYRARVGVMRTARDLADYAQMQRAAQAILASSVDGALDKSEATFTLGLAQSLAGNVSAAEETWASLADDTDNIYGVKSAFYLADSLFSRGEYDEALANVTAIIESGTPHAYWLGRSFILLSDLYHAQGKDFESVEYLRALRDNYTGSEVDIFEMIDSRLAERQ